MSQRPLSMGIQEWLYLGGYILLTKPCHRRNNIIHKMIIQPLFWIGHGRDNSFDRGRQKKLIDIESARCTLIEIILTSRLND
ncbi:hypothetical protein FGO68_gene15374 [Halteria grandinella]|uniref:Uncharacterized protein n=1 Tax=Halteria grandinella TaxID=5974 RepID=A0A8J8NCC3_HALGN|nr:hypothetical protein FGO68_gene15374 [Halteria grandinella]